MSALAKMNPAGQRVREALRAMVHGEEVLARIEGVTAILLRGYEERTDPDTGTVTQLELTSERVGAFKAVLDVQFKLLGKVLPDLKAVELTGADGGPLQVQSVDRMVLATKLLAIMRNAPAVLEGEAEPADEDWLL